MKSVSYLFLLIIFPIIAKPAPASQPPDVFETIMSKIADDLQSGINESSLASTVSTQLSALLPVGCWTDVNYDNPEFEHLARIRTFAEAYSRKNNRFYANAALYNGLTKALQYWLDKDPHNRNWWFNEISFPQQIGQILILMRGAPRALSPEMEGALIQRMTRKLKPHDFANTSDEALHYLYRACLTKDKATLDSAVTFLFEPVSIQANGEGLQVDNSYFQHGRQQAIASYGAVFVSNSYNAAWYLSNTPYAMQAERMRLLSDFFQSTYLRSIVGGFFDFNTRGRGISRVNSMKAGFQPLLHKAQLTDLSITKDSRSSHTNYWVSGYTLHTRPAYSFSVQINSVRTLRTERGNNENLLGRFLPDGATDIRRRGDEYSNIMPVWTWDKLPGVTNREYDNDEGCTIKKEWGIPGTTVFSGGISDSLYGATTYDLEYDSVRAHKSWFFFDREIVCLGSGISSPAPEPVITTIDQRWQKGETWAGTGEANNKPVKAETVKDPPQWIWHDSIGYFFPSDSYVHMSSKEQSGSWYRINHSQPKDPVTGKVFTLWIEHGVAPTDAGYAYIVIPGIDKKGMTAYDKGSIRIIQNTTQLQAVLQTRLDILDLVFFSAGRLDDGDLSVTADRPCIVHIRGVHTARPEVYVSDPSQTQSSLRLTLKLSASSGSRELECVLPKTPYAGSTVKLNLEK